MDLASSVYADMAQSQELEVLSSYHLYRIKSKSSLYHYLSLVRMYTQAISMEESKSAKIRNRYNQVPHLTQDTKVKVTNSQ